MKKLFLLLAFIYTLSAQENVGIGTTTPDNSAILDLDVSSLANKKGLLVPRVSTTERNNISNPANGLIVYDTDEDLFYYNDGTSGSPNWIPVLSETIDLTSDVTGILPVSNGGTGTSSITGMVQGDGANDFTGISAAQDQVTYWSDANTIAGDANFIWNSADQALDVTGSVKATDSVVSDVIQYLPLSTQPSTPFEGMTYFDTGDNELKIYKDGSWEGIGGSGSGIPGGNDGNVQFNNAGSFDGSDDLEWDNANSRLGIGTSAPNESLEINDGNIFLNNSGTATELIFAEPSGSGSNTTSFSAQAQTNDIQYTLPADDGDADEVLTTDGSGVLSWTASDAGWSLTGNSGTTAGTNFLGTTDDVDIQVKRNNSTEVTFTDTGAEFQRSISVLGGGDGERLKLYDPSDSHYSSFESRGGMSQNLNYKLPTSAADSGQVLTDNFGDGNLSWEDTPQLPAASTQGETAYYDSTNAEWASTENMKIYDDAIQMNQAMALNPHEISINTDSSTISKSVLIESSYLIVDITINAIVEIELGDGTYIGQLLIIESDPNGTGYFKLDKSFASNYTLNNNDNIYLMEPDDFVMFIWNGSIWIEISRNDINN